VEERVADPSPAQGRRAWIRRQAGEKREAITALAAVLEKFPGYSWAWNVLLDWLEEDKEWGMAKELLGSVPPQMIAHVTFRRDRLLLLEKAGAEATSLDPEWLQLLGDFPEDVPLHLHRYDSLQNTKRWKEATEVLDRVSQVADGDVYFLARLADVRCHEGKFSEALEHALKVCFTPVEHSVWPVNRVWEVFEAARKEESLAERFRGRLNEDAQPTPRALCRYAEYLIEGESSTLLATKLIRQTRLNHVTRKIISLMKTVEGGSWRGNFHAADLFAILNNRHYPRLVVRFWKRMSKQGHDGDSDAWAEAGRAMVNLRQYRMARRLFQGWRNRQGVRMWSLANYTLVLSRLRRPDLEEMSSTCRDALASLSHDHCARYLTCLQAEAHALLGDKDGLLAMWRDRRGYFDGELKKSEYFKTSERHLVHDIPDMVEALQSGDSKAYRRLLWRLRFQRVKRSRAELMKLLARIVILIWIIFMAVGVFFRG
jgi:tetratricopeptide (TPR) repeat protein